MLAHFKALLESALPSRTKASPNCRLRQRKRVAEFSRKSFVPGNAFIEFRKEEIEQSITDRFAATG